MSAYLPLVEWFNAQVEGIQRRFDRGLIDQATTIVAQANNRSQLVDTARWLRGDRANYFRAAGHQVRMTFAYRVAQVVSNRIDQLPTGSTKLPYHQTRLFSVYNTVWSQPTHCDRAKVQLKQMVTEARNAKYLDDLKADVMSTIQMAEGWVEHDRKSRQGREYLRAISNARDVLYYISLARQTATR